MICRGMQRGKTAMNNVLPQVVYGTLALVVVLAQLSPHMTQLRIDLLLSIQELLQLALQVRIVVRHRRGFMVPILPWSGWVRGHLIL